MKKTAVLIFIVMFTAILTVLMTGCTDSGDGVAVKTEVTVKQSGPETPSSETPDDIGYDRVKAIVTDRVAGASESDIYELEREYDDGRIEYEGSLRYEGYEYEFEIDGATGNILQWEIDEDD